MSTLIFLIITLILVPMILISIILKKAGISRWWAVLWLLPPLNLVGLWVFAYIKWPADELKPPAGVDQLSDKL